MRETLTIYRREIRAYFVSPIPYVFTIIFAAFMGWWFFVQQRFFLMGTAMMDRFFHVIPWTFIFLVPAISMRLWAEETRAGTIESLVTMPVRPWQLVLGKFFAAWTLLAFCLAATLPVPITVEHVGDLDWGPVVGGYLGTCFLGGALLALGLWISALTSHQIVAFLLTAVAGFCLVMLEGFGRDLGGAVGPFLERLSVKARYDSMGRGVIDLRDLLYFVSFLVFFLYLNAQAIANRRYR